MLNRYNKHLRLRRNKRAVILRLADFQRLLNPRSQNKELLLSRLLRKLQKQRQPRPRKKLRLRKHLLKRLRLKRLRLKRLRPKKRRPKKPPPRKLLQKAAKKRRRSRSHGQEVGQ